MNPVIIVSYNALLIFDPLLFFFFISSAVKNSQDINFHCYWPFILVLTFFGSLLLKYFLRLKGNTRENKFGINLNYLTDYLINDTTEKIPHLKTSERIINDTTRLNPAIVWRVETPESIDELQTIIQNADMPISVGGARFSMGGQIGSPNSIHIDTRKLNKIISFSLENKTITVEPGIRWCDVQRFIDRYNLSIKIMQTYANFTVGGSVSVNCHGRYLGLGPLILSIKSISLVLANGELTHASKKENKDLFFGCVGCYNAIGVISSVELELDENIAVERINKTMKSEVYPDYFFNVIRNTPNIVFHNGDLYPPYYKRIRAVNWIKTKKKPAKNKRLISPSISYPIERYFINAFSKNKFAKWRRQYVYDPILYCIPKVHWKNYEAGYDVAELEPKSHKKNTYVLQEYFVPVQQFSLFSNAMADIFKRYNVNVINVSVRHALPDNGSLLAWAREEVFAFVIWYKQGISDAEKNKVGVWTRELIDAAITYKGSYYLPYQIHATIEQFFMAYPNADKLFRLKKKLDPTYKFRNALWDNYYQSNKTKMNNTTSEFKLVFSDPKWSDKFYRFLQIIFHLYPEDKFHNLIAITSAGQKNDREIYRSIQNELPKIKPFLSELTMALPALKKQKKEMAKQVLHMLRKTTTINGYLEIGSTGCYISELRKHIKLSGSIFITNDIPPDNSIADIFERGQLKKLGHFFRLNNYQPIPHHEIANESIDLVTCHIGLHHCPPQLLDNYVKSIFRVLRKNGIFIVRDHDVQTEQMARFVSLVHTVFNLGLNISWETNNAEFKSFKGIEEWSRLISNHGFKDTGERILQDNDPTDNTLIAFIKQ
ncbi:MAG: FAD-binding protein [Bacteroidia bacterium]|nr:FAD-binding protein [Bacteroidia bacterium]